MFYCILVLFVLTASGCATQGVSTKHYIPCSPVNVSNEAIVERSFLQVWDGLVKELSKSFFVINNIDKGSRIINVSFSTNSPKEFVDCGKTQRTYKQGDIVEVFEYDTAESSEFKIAAKRQVHPAFSYYAIFRRDTFLEGRSNIYLAPDEKDQNKTIISVNTRYILTIRSKGEAFAQHAMGRLISQGRIPEETSVVSLNTKVPGQSTLEKDISITCYCKGKLESEILKMLIMQTEISADPKKSSF